MKTTWRVVVRLAAWTAAFVGAGYLGRATIIDDSALSLVWPAAGVAMLWLATGHGRARALDALALVGATFVVNLTTGASPALAGVFAATNLLQVVVFLLLARRLLPDLWGLGGRRPPSRLPELGQLVSVAVVACLLAALVGTAGLQLTGGAASWLGLLVWWGRNAVGLVVVGLVGLLAGPALAPAGAFPKGRSVARSVFRPRSVGRATEAVLLLGGTVAIYTSVFDMGTTRPLAFLLLVPTFWAGIRFMPLAVTLHSLACGALAVVFTLHGDGPFIALTEPSMRALVAQLFVVMTVVAGLSLSFSHTQERQVASELRSLMDGSRLAAMVSTDLDGVIRTFGVGAERLLGYRAEEMVGRQSPTVFHDPDEVAAVAEELGVDPGTALAELASREDEPRIWTFIRRDGGRLSVRLALTVLRDADGNVSGTLGVAFDVTQAQRSRRQLAEANARWEVLMDHLPDTTVLTVDEQLRIDMVAGAGATLTGLADAAGKPLAEVSNPENAALLGDLVGRALAGEVATLDVRATANGHEHQVVATRLPASGAHREVLMVARDVREERARERAVVAARDRAQRLFDDAPQGIALLGTDGVLRQLNPTLCELLGGSADELVGRPLESFSEDAGDPTIADHLRRVVDATSRKAETTWHLLDTGGGSHVVGLSSTLLRGADGPGADLVLANVVDLSERERFQRQLAHLADHDPLTGLANRRRFEHELQRHLDHCRRYGYRGAVLMLDLDHFKDVNDTLGHSAGDELLVSLAGLLRDRMRETDVVARLGGDEFAVLLAEADLAAAGHVAAEVVDMVRDHVATMDGVRRRVTVSVGGVLVDEGCASDLLSNADLMLYDAKDAGRDRHAVLDPQEHSQSRTGARLMWAERIEDALATDGFEFHLQPLLDLHSGRVSGAEALLRMRHGDDLVMPGRFLYVAERSQAIVQLDRWVLRHGVELLARLQQLDPAFRLALNLSAKSVGDASVEAELRQALDRHAVDPRGLVLEITETAAVAHIREARAFIDRLTPLGCRFALDDFGAGFGSFYYLKHLPFDIVKIDGEFVSGCAGSQTDRAIISSVVRMAHELGKQTVAEFVADTATLGVVEELGVDFAQGHHVGQPVPVPWFVARMTGPPALEADAAV